MAPERTRTSGVPPTGGSVAHLGHVELLTPDLEASRRCFISILGMREAGRWGDSILLRGESEYELAGLMLTPSAEPGIGHLGLRARSAALLDARVADLQAAGVDGVWMAAGAGHGPAFRFRTSAGHAIELYWECQRYVPSPEDQPPARDRLTRRGGPGVGVRRLDHVNLLAADVPAAADLAWRGLGATLLDELQEDDGSISGAWLTFGQRPLELVYTRDRRGLSGRLHHVAFWVDTREEVLRAADILSDQGVTIEVPPAQHTIGRSFFLYAFEPGGNRFEITTGADLVLDPDPPTRRWTAAERRAGIGWGTVFPPTWGAYGTPNPPAVE